VTSAIADWVHACYVPIVTGTMEAQEGRTTNDLLPWGDTPVSRALATRSVTPGSQTGINWIQGPSTGNMTPCNVYLEAVTFQTQNWLGEMKSPNGTPLNEVFQQELQLDPRTQAQFILYREMLRAAGPAVPAPSLSAAYATLRGLSVGGQAVGGAASGGGGGW